MDYSAWTNKRNIIKFEALNEETCAMRLKGNIIIYRCERLRNNLRLFKKIKLLPCIIETVHLNQRGYFKVKPGGRQI